MDNKKSLFKKILIVCFWVAVWSVTAIIVNNDIVLVGPVNILLALFNDAITLNFWMIVFNSLFRILLGFLAGALLGMVLGGAGYRYSLVKEVLSPFVSVIKSIPVASFVVLLLIWSGAGILSFYISLLIVFPQIYVGTLSGLQSTDEKLLVMAKDYQYSFLEKILFIYKDSVLPYIESNLKVTLGLAFKSGVAAELIGLPDSSIGSRLYMSKIYLDTAHLFSWTIVVVAISYCFEKLFLFLLSKIKNYAPTYNSNKLRKMDSKDGEFKLDNGKPSDVVLNNIYVSYDGKAVIENENVNLKSSGTYMLTGPSGIGKTTMVNYIKENAKGDKSIQYQENRLLDKYDVITNVLLGNRNIDCRNAYDEIVKILPKECIYQRVSELSGGMKRRVALMRALLKKSDMVLLDEPFTGLDEDNRKRAMDTIMQLRGNRTLLFVSHDMEDAGYMEATEIAICKKQ